MKIFTVSASFCEHFDSLDVRAETAEEAIKMFKETLEKRGYDQWADESIVVREVPSEDEKRMIDRDLPVWKEGRFFHGGAYNYNI